MEPGEPRRLEQPPLHLGDIRPGEFDPRGQAVHVQQKGLGIALHTLGFAVNIRDDLPQEGPDETQIRIQGAGS
jgi:hypothetical protein